MQCGDDGAIVALHIYNPTKRVQISRLTIGQDVRLPRHSITITATTFPKSERLVTCAEIASAAVRRSSSPAPQTVPRARTLRYLPSDSISHPEPCLNSHSPRAALWLISPRSSAGDHLARLSYPKRLARPLSQSRARASSWSLNTAATPSPLHSTRSNHQAFSFSLLEYPLQLSSASLWSSIFSNHLLLLWSSLWSSNGLNLPPP